MHRISLLLVLLLASGSLAAEWGVAGLMAALATSERPPTAYRELRHSAFLDQPLTSRGTLRIDPAGRLIKESDSPAQRLLVDDQGITIERAGEPTQTLPLEQRPALATLVAGIRGLLSGDRATLERHFQLALNGEASGWQLTLTPLSNGPLRELVAHGSQGAVRRLTIVEGDGDMTELLLGADRP